MRRKLIWIAPAAIVGICLLVALGGEVVRLLWNALLPPLFGFPAVTFWQALGLLALCRILFGGLIGHGRPRGPRFRGENLTPEERARLRERMIRWRCGPETGSETRES